MNQRIARVRAAMQAQGLAQILVSDPKSVWYLTGVEVEPYERLLALYLPLNGEPTLFLNRLFNVPNPPCKAVWHDDAQDPVAQIAAVVNTAETLGIDKEWPAKFLIPLMQRCRGMDVVLASDCVDDCRACKDETEQTLMREASRINDEVNAAVKQYIRPTGARTTALRPLCPLGPTPPTPTTSRTTPFCSPASACWWIWAAAKTAIAAT